MSEFSGVARSLYRVLLERFKDNPDPHLTVMVALKTEGFREGIFNAITNETLIEAETARLIKRN